MLTLTITLDLIVFVAGLIGMTRNRQYRRVCRMRLAQTPTRHPAVLRDNHRRPQ